MLDSIALAKEKYLDEINNRSINFVMADEEKIGSAGEQPISNNRSALNE